MRGRIEAAPPLSCKHKRQLMTAKQLLQNVQHDVVGMINLVKNKRLSRLHASSRTSSRRIRLKEADEAQASRAGLLSAPAAPKGRGRRPRQPRAAGRLVAKGLPRGAGASWACHAGTRSGGTQSPGSAKSCRRRRREAGARTCQRTRPSVRCTVQLSHCIRSYPYWCIQLSGRG